jgi:arylsulfatase A-like enzyme/Flp pilus assembly protein TadD
MGLALALAAAWFAWQTFYKAPKIRNVLLISIDTCRPDRLSCYGYPSKTTPNIDAIAAEGTLFQNAYSPVPMTLPAHCSMLTGTIPPYNGVHDNGQYGFDETTLAGLLKARGFHTTGIVSAEILDRRYGLNQGFDAYLDTMPATSKGKLGKERKGGDTTRLALDFLDRNREKPFFLFLHYYDPHSPYEPPEPFATPFKDRPYDGEIAFVDSCIGQVAGKLKGLGLYDSTLLVIASDHGEMLGEHGEIYHMFFVYQAAVKVALVVKAPGQKRGLVVEEPVGLIDIVPTICSLVRAQSPRNIQGVDLTPHLKGRKMAKAGRGYYCESLSPTKFGGNTLLALVQGNWKYIQTSRPELYDLEKDPGEETNLVSSRAEIAASLQGRLKALLEKEVRSHSGGEKVESDPKALAALAALGYVRGSVVEDFSFSQDKEDPKDLIGYHADRNRVQEMIRQEKYGEAKDLCGKMLKDSPNVVFTYELLGTISLVEKDYAAAENAFRKTLELEPREYRHHNNLGLALTELSKMDEAFRHFEEAVKLEPRSSETFSYYGIALRRAGRFDDAERKFRKALEINPINYNARRGLAKTLLAQDKTNDALLEYAELQKSAPPNVEIFNDLAAVFLRKGDRANALANWASSLRLNPNQPEVLSDSARTLLEMGRPELSLQSLLQLQPGDSRVMCKIAALKADARYPQISNPAEALALARKACEISGPRDPISLYALAAALAASQRYAEAAEAASKALKLAEEAGDALAIANIKNLLETCKRGQPGK